MKQSLDDDIIQKRMRPGVITLDGLMGVDQRNLRDILDADDAAVRRLGLTHAGIVARMRELRDAGARGLGDPVNVHGLFEVRVDSVQGKLACPFPHAGLCRKELVEIRNVRRGEQVTFTELNMHLIEAHGFYEGVGSPFRQDPARLARVLEIAPGG